MKKIIAFLLVTTILGLANSLQCDSLANAIGEDPSDSTRCLCQQDFYWEDNRCLSIAEFFDGIEVASYNLELGENIVCQDTQFAASGTCLDCSTEVSNCVACTAASANGTVSVNGSIFVNGTEFNLSINNTIVTCQKCTDFSYISVVNNVTSCLLCSEGVSNCFLCSSEIMCTECLNGYFLKNSSLCTEEPTCNVDNCELCQLTDPSLCQQCFGDYQISQGADACEKPVCEGELFFDGLACTCRRGFFVDDTACTACIDNCLSCSSITDCLIAVDTYVVLGTGIIVTCATATGDNNCLQCPNSVCTSCKNGFVNVDGFCTRFIFGFRGFFFRFFFGIRRKAFCGRGMRSCSAGSGSGSTSMATSCFRGSALFNGNCFKCASGVRSCNYNSVTQTTIPTQCARKWFLVNGVCVKCDDTNCEKCTRSAFCKSCVDGYAAVDGVCVACSTGCLTCIAEDTCLSGKCGAGFGYVEEVVEEEVNGVTTNVTYGRCNQCIAGCGVCDNDITECDSCSDGLYDAAEAGATTLDCVVCPTNCATCTSDTVCTDCAFGFTLVGTFCIQQCSFPCSDCDSTDPTICTECFGGYTLTNGACAIELSCSPCYICPKGYFLTDTNTCVTCAVTSTDNCVACLQQDISVCAECSEGYFLEDGACIACSTGCAICEDSTTCLQAMAGYYLISQTSAIVQICNQNCATCSGSANSCASCPTGYFLKSNYCQSNRRVNYGLKLGGAGYTLDFFRLIFFFWFGRFALKIRRKRRRCGFRRLFFSSVNIEGDITIDPEQNPTTVIEDVESGVSSGDIGGLEVESSSISATGFTLDDSTNLELILGVSIPVGILLIAIVIAVIVKLKNKGGNYSKADYQDQNATQQEFPKGDNYL